MPLRSRKRNEKDPARLRLPTVRVGTLVVGVLLGRMAAPNLPSLLQSYYTVHEANITAIVAETGQEGLSFFEDLTKSSVDDIECSKKGLVVVRNTVQDHVDERYRIPRVIHVTSKSRCMTPAFANNIDKWRFQNHSLYFHDDEAMDRYLSLPRKEVPHLQQVLECVTSKAAKSDIWRYLLLWEYGGIYTDMDNTPSGFQHDTISPEDDAFFILESLGIPAQYFLAASPRHPVMYFALMDALRAIMSLPDYGKNSPPFTTGPRALKNGYIQFLADAGIESTGYTEAGLFCGARARCVKVVGHKNRSQQYVHRDGVPNKLAELQKMNMTHYHHDQAPNRESCLSHMLNSYSPWPTCFCPTTCDQAALSKRNEYFTCGQRIRYLIQRYGLSEKLACIGASEGPDAPCGSECNPEICQAGESLEPIVAATTKENTNIGPATEVEAVTEPNQDGGSIDVSFERVQDTSSHPHMGARDESGMFGYVHDVTALHNDPAPFPGANCTALRDEDRKALQRLKVATPSYTTKLLCAVYSVEAAHDTRIPAIRETWGSRCDGFFVGSNKTVRSLDTVDIPHIGVERYGNMWQKVRSIWAYIYDNYYESFDWFHLGGDDMFLIVENLRYFLESEEIHAAADAGDAKKQIPLYLGSTLLTTDQQDLYNTGGPGYTLNKAALKLLVTKGFPNHYKYLEKAAEDVFVARTFRHFGVSPFRTTDGDSERYHHFPPGRHYLNHEPHFYKQFTKTMNYTVGQNHSSIYSASFHYVGHDEARRYHAFLYGLCNDTENVAYDPLGCKNMVNGHCRDQEGGGAWSYRKEDGTCRHTEANIPRDPGAVNALPTIFPGIKSVLDFGGGPGGYLTGFRDQDLYEMNLVVMEPHPLADCLFQGLKQDTTDLINTPLSKLPKEKYDLVMTVEVAEHIPVQHHDHLVDALSQATSQWLLFSAAHPGQPGEGHVGPSMKTRDQWIEEFETKGVLVVDETKTKALHRASGRLLKSNAVVFRRKSSRNPGIEPTDTEFPYPLSCPNEELPTGSYSVAIAYHVGLMNNWETVVNDQMRTLERCGLGSAVSDVLLSYAGGDLQSLLNVLKRRPDISKAFSSPVSVVKSSKAPWEGPMMNAVRDFCQARAAKKQKTIVFYFHDKGVSRYQDDWRDKLEEYKSYAPCLYWRKYMEYFTIERPGLCLDKIVNKGASTCGVLRRVRPKSHYSGNFWVADCDYVQTLPLINMTEPKSRMGAFEAEFWIGQNRWRHDPETHVSLHNFAGVDPYRTLLLPEMYSDHTV